MGLTVCWFCRRSDAFAHERGSGCRGNRLSETREPAGRMGRGGTGMTGGLVHFTVFERRENWENIQKPNMEKNEKIGLLAGY